MTKLNTLLKEMDEYPWESVPDYKKIDPECKEILIKLWNRTFEESKFALKGSVLDVCCGAISIGAIYNNTVGLDVDPIRIKEIRKNGIKGIIGDFRNMPFDDNSFDIATCFYPPLSPYNKNDCKRRRRNDSKRLVKRVTKELIRVARKYVLLTNDRYVRVYAPFKFKKYIQKKGDSYLLYNLKKK